jgi:hypothetical protein
MPAIGCRDFGFWNADGDGRETVDMSVAATVEWQPLDMPADVNQAHVEMWNSAYAHISLQNNPHQVTAAQAGADPAGSASGAITAHLGEFVHGDISHTNRANLDSINQALGTGSSVAFAGLTVDVGVIRQRGLPGTFSFTISANDENGPRLQLGSFATPNAYFEVGAWSNINNFDSKARDLRLYTDAGDGLRLKKTTGIVGINQSAPSAQLHVNTGAVDRPALVAQGIAGQSANVFECRNSAGSARFMVLDSGSFRSYGTAFCGTYADTDSATYSKLVHGGTNKTITLNTNNADRHRTDSSGLWLMGAAGTHAYGLGDPAADGSVRLVQSGMDISFDKREAGAWSSLGLASQIAHSNRANLNSVNQNLGTGSSVTFAGVKVAGESVYKNNDVIMNTNHFGGRKLYINTFNNAAFRAHKRWTVTGNYYFQADNSLVGVIPAAGLANMFDGDYDSKFEIPAGQYAVITITFDTETGGVYPGYPYGYFYLSAYFDEQMASASARVYCTYASQGIGWKNINFSPFVQSATNQILKSDHAQYYAISILELTVQGNPLGSTKTSITEFEWQLDRPGKNEMPYVDKYKANKLYNDLNMNSNNLDGVLGLYFGSSTSDGSWRMMPSGADLLIQKRVSGAWVTKSTISGA